MRIAFTYIVDAPWNARGGRDNFCEAQYVPFDLLIDSFTYICISLLHKRRSCHQNAEDLPQMTILKFLNYVIYII